ncbi:hypothetical protein [Photobacterium atrarenae]|uniref:Chemotaxis protein n=1 Tax=Photobacterium atrarenae TaxID=865757 RepID=A0ABY5GKW0_9GAMM|nr:hypothetical protein [Photobacterium atrarenae]UTV29760.1 hypothetical protein NNL38_22390 [Photobacterium atrarenae]
MLVAALVASPLALADGYDYGYDHDGDVTIEGSGNLSVYKNAEFSKTKNIYKSNVGNTDDDKLILKDVGNYYKNTKEINKEVDASFTKKFSKEVEKYLAESKLYGDVMDASVTYGGACCKGNPSTVVVDHENSMYRAFGDSSGISMAGQNVGNNSMVQQTTSTNAALVGSGGGVVSPDTGNY